MIAAIIGGASGRCRWQTVMPPVPLARFRPARMHGRGLAHPIPGGAHGAVCCLFVSAIGLRAAG